MKLNSNTIIIDGNDYKELESIISKVASDNNISNVKEVECSLTKESGTVQFSIERNKESISFSDIFKSKGELAKPGIGTNLVQQGLQGLKGIGDWWAGKGDYSDPFGTKEKEEEEKDEAEGYIDLDKQQKKVPEEVAQEKQPTASIKLNSNTLLLDNSDYKELENIISKIAVENNISSVKNIKCILNKNSGEINFKIKEAVGAENMKNPDGTYGNQGLSEEEADKQLDAYGDTTNTKYPDLPEHHYLRRQEQMEQQKQQQPQQQQAPAETPTAAPAVNFSDIIAKGTLDFLGLGGGKQEAAKSNVQQAIQAYQQGGDSAAISVLKQQIPNITNDQINQLMSQIKKPGQTPAAPQQQNEIVNEIKQKYETGGKDAAMAYLMDPKAKGGGYQVPAEAEKYLNQLAQMGAIGKPGEQQQAPTQIAKNIEETPANKPYTLSPEEQAEVRKQTTPYKLSPEEQQTVRSKMETTKTPEQEAAVKKPTSEEEKKEQEAEKKRMEQAKKDWIAKGGNPAMFKG